MPEESTVCNLQLVVLHGVQIYIYCIFTAVGQSRGCVVCKGTSVYNEARRVSDIERVACVILEAAVLQRQIELDGIQILLVLRRNRR